MTISMYLTPDADTSLKFPLRTSGVPPIGRVACSVINKPLSLPALRVIPGARCPRLPGGIVLGNQVGAGGRGDWGWGCVNRRHLPLPSLSCRSLYGPCLGSASVKVSIMSIIRGPTDLTPIIISAVSQESASLSRFSHRLHVCVVSFACAVPSWKPPGTGLVVCVHPVPPTAVALRPRGQYHGEGWP